MRRFAALYLVILQEETMLTTMGIMSRYRQLFGHTPPPSTLQDALAAAEGGDADAQFGLGLKFSADGEATQDLARAAAWYRKAADQDHALAQINLGVMLSEGQGVPQDEVAAMAWTRRAAEGGDPGAQFSLGSRCHRHSSDHRKTDCRESRVEAYKWFHLAADQGYFGSEAACQRMTLDMSCEEVTDGIRRAAAFVVRQPARPPMPSSAAPIE